MISFVKKAAVGCIITALILSLLFVITNLILGEPTLSQNDRHVMWIVDGRDFFVESKVNNNLSNILMKPNPLLRYPAGKASFLKNKESETFRIFCIGGSTTEGWPFNPYFSYPKLLSVYLQDLLPQKKIEVINAGFCGSDSFSDVLLVKEVLNYQPDLLLIYEGRNEFQLAYHIGYRSRLIKIHTWLLRHVYLYSFVQNRLLLKDEKFNHAENIRIFVSQKFKFSNRLSHRFFMENIGRMLKMAARKRCKIILLTQVLSPEEIQNESIMAEINDWLGDIALQYRVVLIDIDKIFRNSERPVEELIIPVSVHPDLEGYILMAKTICRELARRNIVAPEAEWVWTNLKSKSQYFQQINLTPDFLSHVYSERIGKDFLEKANRPDLANLYYKRAEQYLEEGDKFLVENEVDLNLY